MRVFKEIAGLLPFTGSGRKRRKAKIRVSTANNLIEKREDNYFLYDFKQTLKSQEGVDPYVSKQTIIS